MKLIFIIMLPLMSYTQSYDTHVKSLYDSCGLHEQLSYKLFYKALTGFYNLKHNKKLKGNLLIIVDYRQRSEDKRFYVIDISNKRLLHRTKVAHGRNSGNKYAISFSNKDGSHKSSVGFFVTGEKYIGKNGLSLRLDGLDMGYNDNARKRNLVIHGASYISNESTGRSYGCLSLPTNIIASVIDLIEGGNCLLVYTSDYKGSIADERFDTLQADSYLKLVRANEELYEILK